MSGQPPVESTRPNAAHFVAAIIAPGMQSIKTAEARRNVRPPVSSPRKAILIVFGHAVRPRRIRNAIPPQTASQPSSPASCVVDPLLLRDT